LVSTPNNSLALSYLLHIRRKRYGLIPLPVRREGAGYHDGRPGESGGGKEKLAGAAAIRKGLLSGEAWTAGAVPASVSVLLEEAKTNGRLCLDGAGTKILWTLLCGLLLRSTPEDLREASGMDEGLENLFLKHFLHAASYEDFIGRCVSARYTRGRLQRASIRLLTGFGRHVSALSREGPPYIRVLGFNRHGRELLRGAASALPFITRLPAARLSAKYGEAAGRYAEMEYRASRLWELLVPASDPRHEEKQRPVGL
jgi:predicted nucleotidyltransferase